jgi:zinc transport system permease protein
MAAFAAIIGSVSALAGLWGSYRFDTPTGPSIVVAAVLCLLLANVADAVTARFR